MNDSQHNRVFGTLDKVESLVQSAQEMGYKIRYDHFGGTGGGVCEFGGKKWLFIDVSLSAIEQLEMLEEELQKDASLPIFPIAEQNPRRAA